MKHYVFDEYVITPIPNAFNQKYSYWITKKGYTVAYYVFSDNKTDALVHDPGIVGQCIAYFEQRITQKNK